MSLSSGLLNSDIPVAHDEGKVQVEGVLQHSDIDEKHLSNTPPSSPPVYQKSMASQSQDMPPPTAPASRTRKRSRGEAPDVAINVPDSSAALCDDLDPLSSQDKKQDTATDFAAADEPNVHGQQLAQSSQPVPTSAQHGQIAHRHARPERTSKNGAPAKQSQQQPYIEEAGTNLDMTTASNDPGLPEDQFESFDWSELESRYHAKLAVLQNREMGHCKELSNLVAFFEIWAEVGGRKEDDRGFKRLKTQMAYVQHQENELEKKRLHYIRVVDAFKTVGVMLKEPNWAQSFIPDHKSLLKVRRSILRRVNPSNDASTRPEKRKRDSRNMALIKAEEWPVRVVEDVAMKRFGCRDRRVARCVIL